MHQRQKTRMDVSFWLVSKCFVGNDLSNAISGSEENILLFCRCWLRYGKKHLPCQAAQKSGWDVQPWFLSRCWVSSNLVKPEKMSFLYVSRLYASIFIRSHGQIAGSLKFVFHRQGLIFSQVEMSDACPMRRGSPVSTERRKKSRKKSRWRKQLEKDESGRCRCWGIKRVPTYWSVECPRCILVHNLLPICAITYYELI
jgi:hypothetical protein